MSGTLQQLDSGRALRLRGCRPVALPAGASTLAAPPGAVFRADHLRLASAAPRPLATTGAPQVSDSGEGWNGSRDGVRLSLAAPAWLVLAESWSKGWHAYCAPRGGDESDLGAPTPIDAFAVGWQAPAGCAVARFEFRPQRLATGAYVVSAVAVGLMLLALVLLVAKGSDPQKPSRAQADALGLTPPAALLKGSDPQTSLRSSDPPLRLTPRYALAAGLAIALVGGFLFALRAGVVLGPLAVLALRAGVTVRRLLLVAAGCIGALPLIYLVFPARDRGGNEFGYPNDLVGAHWVALLAVLCLLAAGLLLAARLRRASGSGSRSST